MDDRRYIPKPRKLMAVAEWVDPDELHEPLDEPFDESPRLVGSSAF
jgi:hypothetical protein